MISDVSQRAVPLAAAHQRAKDAAILGSGHHRATAGVEGVGVVKGGVASLISKFQCRSSSYGSSKVIVETSSRGHSREQKPVASAACASADSGIYSSTMENDCCSVGETRLSFRNEAVETARGKQRESNYIGNQSQKSGLSAFQPKASESKRLSRAETGGLIRKQTSHREEHSRTGVGFGMHTTSDAISNHARPLHVGHLSGHVSKENSRINISSKIARHQSRKKISIVPDQGDLSSEFIISKSASSSKGRNANAFNHELEKGRQVIENKNTGVPFKAVDCGDDLSMTVEKMQFSNASVRSLGQDGELGSRVGVVQHASRYLEAARVTMDSGYCTAGLLSSSKSPVKRPDRNVSRSNERKHFSDTEKHKNDMCPVKQKHGVCTVHQEHGICTVKQELGLCTLKQEHGLCTVKQEHGLCTMKQEHGLCTVKQEHGLCTMKQEHGVCTMKQEHGRYIVQREHCGLQKSPLKPTPESELVDSSVSTLATMRRYSTQRKQSTAAFVGTTANPVSSYAQQEADLNNHGQEISRIVNVWASERSVESQAEHKSLHRGKPKLPVRNTKQELYCPLVDKYVQKGHSDNQLQKELGDLKCSEDKAVLFLETPALNVSNTTAHTSMKTSSSSSTIVYKEAMASAHQLEIKDCKQAGDNQFPATPRNIKTKSERKEDIYKVHYRGESESINSTFRKTRVSAKTDKINRSSKNVILKTHTYNQPHDCSVPPRSRREITRAQWRRDTPEGVPHEKKQIEPKFRQTSFDKMSSLNSPGSSKRSCARGSLYSSLTGTPTTAAKKDGSKLETTKRDTKCAWSHIPMLDDFEKCHFGCYARERPIEDLNCKGIVQVETVCSPPGIRLDPQSTNERSAEAAALVKPHYQSSTPDPVSVLPVKVTTGLTPTVQWTSRELTPAEEQYSRHTPTVQWTSRELAPTREQSPRLSPTVQWTSRELTPADGQYSRLTPTVQWTSTELAPAEDHSPRLTHTVQWTSRELAPAEEQSPRLTPRVPWTSKELAPAEETSPRHTPTVQWTSKELPPTREQSPRLTPTVQWTARELTPGEGQYSRLSPTVQWMSKELPQTREQSPRLTPTVQWTSRELTPGEGQYSRLSPTVQWTSKELAPVEDPSARLAAKVQWTSRELAPAENQSPRLTPTELWTSKELAPAEDHSPRLTSRVPWTSKELAPSEEPSARLAATVPGTSKELVPTKEQSPKLANTAKCTTKEWAPKSQSPKLNPKTKCKPKECTAKAQSPKLNPKTKCASKEWTPKAQSPRLAKNRERNLKQQTAVTSLRVLRKKTAHLAEANKTSKALTPYVSSAPGMYRSKAALPTDPVEPCPRAHTATPLSIAKGILSVSDVSLMPKTIAVNDEKYVSKSPSLEIPRQVSFTKIFRSESPSLSHAINKCSIRCGNLVQRVPLECSATNEWKTCTRPSKVLDKKPLCTSDGIRRTKLALVSSNCSRGSSSGRMFNILDNLDKQRDTVLVDSRRKQFKKIQVGTPDNALSPEAICNTKALSINDKLEGIVANDLLIGRTFHKYNSTLVCNQNEVSKTVVEEEKEIQECCIVVESMEEAHHVASTLLKSAGLDLHSLGWGHKTKTREYESNYERAGSSDSELVVRKTEDDFHRTYTRSNPLDSECQYEVDSGGNVCSLDRYGTFTDKFRYHSRPVAKWKHLRKPLASVGEINLSDQLCTRVVSQNDETGIAIPNIRMISIQPMICIPWHDVTEGNNDGDVVERNQRIKNNVLVEPAVPRVSTTDSNGPPFKESPLKVVMDIPYFTKDEHLSLEERPLIDHARKTILKKNMTINTDKKIYSQTVDLMSETVTLNSLAELEEIPFYRRGLEPTGRHNETILDRTPKDAPALKLTPCIHQPHGAADSERNFTDSEVSAFSRGRLTGDNPIYANSDSHRSQRGSTENHLPCKERVIDKLNTSGEFCDNLACERTEKFITVVTNETANDSVSSVPAPDTSKLAIGNTSCEKEYINTIHLHVSKYLGFDPDIESAQVFNADKDADQLMANEPRPTLHNETSPASVSSVVPKPRDTTPQHPNNRHVKIDQKSILHSPHDGDDELANSTFTDHPFREEDLCPNGGQADNFLECAERKDFPTKLTCSQINSYTQQDFQNSFQRNVHDVLRDGACTTVDVTNTLKKLIKGLEECSKNAPIIRHKDELVATCEAALDSSPSRNNGQPVGRLSCTVPGNTKADALCSPTSRDAAYTLQNDAGVSPNSTDGGQPYQTDAHLRPNVKSENLPHQAVNVITSSVNDPPKYNDNIERQAVKEPVDLPYICRDSAPDSCSRNKVSFLAAKFSSITSTNYQQLPNLRWTRKIEEGPTGESKNEKPVQRNSPEPAKEEYPIILLKLKEQQVNDEKVDSCPPADNAQGMDILGEANNFFKGGIAKRMTEYLSSISCSLSQQIPKDKTLLDLKSQKITKDKTLVDIYSQQMPKDKTLVDLNCQQISKDQIFLDLNSQKMPKDKTLLDYNSLQIHKDKTLLDLNSQQISKDKTLLDINSQQIPKDKTLLDLNSQQISKAKTDMHQCPPQTTTPAGDRCFHQFNDGSTTSTYTTPNSTPHLTMSHSKEVITEQSHPSDDLRENKQILKETSVYTTTGEIEDIQNYVYLAKKTKPTKISNEDDTINTLIDQLTDPQSGASQSSMSPFQNTSVTSNGNLQIIAVYDPTTFTKPSVVEPSKNTSEIKLNSNDCIQENPVAVLRGCKQADRSTNMQNKQGSTTLSESTEASKDVTSLTTDTLPRNKRSSSFKVKSNKVKPDCGLVPTMSSEDKQPGAGIALGKLCIADIVDTGVPKQSLYIDYLCSSMEESADSFNCLFIENVKYLKEASADSSKPAKQDGLQGVFKRKRSFSKQSSVATNTSFKDKKTGDKKDRNLTSSNRSNSIQSTVRTVPATAQSSTQPSIISSTSPTKVNPSPTSSGKRHAFKPPEDSGTSPDITDDKCLSFSESESLYLSNVSDPRTSTGSEIYRAQHGFNDSVSQNLQAFSPSVSFRPFGPRQNASLNLQESIQDESLTDRTSSQNVNLSRHHHASDSSCKDENNSGLSHRVTSEGSNNDSSNDLNNDSRNDLNNASSNDSRNDLNNDSRNDSDNNSDSTENTGQESEQTEEVDMDARLRRRLLQKSSDVSAVEPASWRSRVYQNDNTNSSNLSRQSEETRNSFQTSERLSFLDSQSNDAGGVRESRRRRSEDSNNKELVERLARRRAQRLEEQRDSLSQDGSQDSSRDRDSRWSRDASIRSVDSVESSEADDRRAVRLDGGSSISDASKSRRRSSRDNVVSTGSIDNNESSSKIPWHPRSESDYFNGDPEPVAGEFRGRKWSSKDSNFISADSSCSFKSCEDERDYITQLPSRSCCSEDTNRGESIGSGGEKMRKVFRDVSQDSALSREKSEDASNSNNNNDAILVSPAISCFSGALRKHRMDNLIDESEEINNLSKIDLQPVFNGGTPFATASSRVNGSEYIKSMPLYTIQIQSTGSSLVDIAPEGGISDTPIDTTDRDGSRDRGKTRSDAGGLTPGGDHRTETDPQDTGDAKDFQTSSDGPSKAKLEPAVASYSFVDAMEVEAPKPSIATTKETKKRRPRKDKSALRKSALNKADASAAAHADAEGNSSLGLEEGHPEEKPRKAPEGSFVSQHAIFWEKHAPNIQNSTPSRPRTNVPNRYTGDKEKLNATRQKFMQNAASTTETTPSSASRLKPERGEDAAPKPLVRGRTDFNQLLQKFSGSESNSEKSDADGSASNESGVPRRRSFVRRQEAISSSEGSDTRRTPERVQSLKLPSRFAADNRTISSTTLPEGSSAIDKSSSAIERSSSVRSDFMNRKWAQKSVELSQNEPSPARTTTSPTTSAKTPLDSTKVEARTTSSSSNTQHHEVSTKSSVLTPAIPKVDGYQGLPSSSEPKSLDSKSHFRRSFTHSEGNSIKNSASSTPTAAKTPLEKTASFNSSPKIATTHSKAVVFNTPINITTSLGDKTVGPPILSPARSDVTDKTNETALGEKPLDKTTGRLSASSNTDVKHNQSSINHETTSFSASSSLDVTHNQRFVSIKSVEKSVGIETSLSGSVKEKDNLVPEKSVDGNHLSQVSRLRTSSGAAVKHSEPVVSETSVRNVGSFGEKSVDKATNIEGKALNKSTNIEKRAVDKTTSLFEKQEDKTTSLVEKPVDKTASLGEMSVNKALNIDVKSVDKAPSVDVKSVDKAPSVDVKSVDKAPFVTVKSADKSPSVDVKSVNKEPVVTVKSVDKAPSVDVKSVDKAPVATVKSVDKAPSVDVKSVDKAPVVTVKSSVDKAPSVDVKSVNKEPVVNVKSVDIAPSLDVNSVDKAPTLDVKSVDKAPILDVRSVNKAPTLGVKSLDKAPSVDVKSVDKAPAHDVKSDDKAPSVDVKPIDKAPSFDVKSVDKAPILDVKPIDKAPSLDVKSVDKAPSLDVKSVDKEPSLDVKSVDKAPSVEVKSVDTAPSFDVKSVDKASNLDVKSVDTAPDSATQRNHPLPKPRSSLEREAKPESKLPTPSDSVPNAPAKSVASTLSSSVSSTEIKMLSVSTESISSNMSEVRRASSFKDVSAFRADSIEKRKGILKRNTSLSKHDVIDGADTAKFPIIDPQLAKILRQRKQMVGDSSDKEEAEEKMDEVSDLVRRRKSLIAAEEIEETVRYSHLQAAQRGLNPDQDEGLKRISVAERIYSMQTKIEEDKFPVVTPKSRSGLSTPGSRRRSGVITPNSQKANDEILQQSSMSSSLTTAVETKISASSSSSNILVSKPQEQQQEKQPEQHRQDGEQSAVSGPQLMEKLSKIADDSEKYQQRRHRFQHRARNDWRHQTQPVTYDEIQAADCLETVSVFRALVRRQASLNALDHVKAQTPTASKQPLPMDSKKTEFPQHIIPLPKLSRRNRKLRHRTLPVTAEELNAVPEHQMLVTDPDWVKLDKFDKADSGILSGSEADSLYKSESLRSLSLEMDLSENDPSRLSVTDKASIFRILEEKTKAERDKEKSASGAKRYINRKKRERSQTTPITDEEVKSASEIGESSSSGLVESSRAVTVSPHQPEVVNRSRSNSITEDVVKEEADDELVKLSLTEKVKLFSQPKEAEKPLVKTEVVVVRRRARKVASRFNTQPVTTEEVEKAAAYSRISPLAMSMVKPPDPDILKVLPLKDQRELMAQHAEMFLSQNSLRSRSGSIASQSQPSSRRASVTLEEGQANTQDDDEESEKNDKKGILKDKSASAKDLHDVKSILKADPVKAKSESEVHSILKMEVKSTLDTSLSSSEPRGILKKTKSEDIGLLECGDDIKGILKHADTEEEDNHIKPRSRSNSQPLGILKIENANQPADHPLEIRSILKAPSQESIHDLPVMKSAMRRGSIEGDTNVPSGGALKSALRTRSKNSLESEDSHVEEAAASDGSNGGSYDCDLNSNNSHKHVNLTISTLEESVDHFSSITESKIVTSTTISCKSLSSVDVQGSSFQASSVQASSVHASSVQAYSGTSSTVTAKVSSSLSNLQVPEGTEDRSGQSASDDGESSSGEILDDTPRTSKLKRKSRFTDKAAMAERYKTQPPELTDTASETATSGDSTPRRKYKYEGRHKTQPVTPNEMREAEAITPAGDLTRTPGGSIADRLNQLKSSGEEEWKKRVGRKEEVLASPDIIKLREKTGVLENRPCSIADRLNELETSMTTWKERVEESDAKQFTVAGRLVHGPTESPLYSKLKNLPRKDEPGSKNSSPLSSPVTPTKDFIAKIPLPKDIVQDTSVTIESLNRAAPGNGLGDEAEEKRKPVKVEIPDMGEEIENFFAVKPIEEITDKVEMEVDDFNNIFIESEMILSTVRKVRPARKTKPSSHNPLKNMSQKIDIQNEYTEVMYGTAEKELKRVKKEGLAKDAGFAQAALAGLASKENFKQVELRRTDSGSSVHGQAFDPFKEVMLLHVKGRRSVQTRLVEPHARSINEGDCYILVTSDKVIHWEGRYANVIEKAKASEVASYIQQKKDLGCKKSNEVLTTFQEKDHLGAGKPFWAALEGEKQFQACGPDAEDELYESSIVKCNMVYRLVGNALQPYEEYWGAIPRHEMLKKNEVIIFDFGTEFYVWQGKAVSMEQRKLGLKLSKQLYEKGYDYTESPINPLSPLRIEDSGGLPQSSPVRPSWAIFGKVNQNMETILFREKFADWPDSSRLIGCKGHGPSETVSKELLEMKPFDAKRMIPVNTAPVNLKLEGANLGRGVKWSEDMQGFVKELDIITLDVIAWHVLEYSHYKLSELSHGQFHDGDTYVVRWQYMVANANLRSLKGNAARNSLTGRERCAYFFWQGNQSTINEKGASALMTVELDEERGPQVRVLQGKEPPCFLNLFGGRMILHIGKREDPTTNSQGSWRLYCLRGDYENEIYLLEIPVSVRHLRSRSSLVLLNVKTGIVYVWHGAKSPKHVRELCLNAVSRLKEKTPLEVGLHEQATITVVEVEEGEEKPEIWSALDKQDRSIYNSLLTDPRSYNHTIRLFHMSSVNLVFEVYEQLNPAHASDLVTPFPFLQSDLYRATQPGLFLIDNGREVYLWQGWWPVGSHDTENVHTGSAIARFNLDRRLAMETTLHYCREKNPQRPPTAYLVCAGVEPVCFTSLFPYWEDDTIVKDIASEEGKILGYKEPVSEILHRLTKTRYTLAELQERPLPEGVDPLKLETYLFDADFEEILEMNREEFYGQPHWKQIDLKKNLGLF